MRPGKPPGLPAAELHVSGEDMRAFFCHIWAGLPNCNPKVNCWGRGEPHVFAAVSQTEQASAEPAADRAFTCWWPGATGTLPPPVAGEQERWVMAPSSPEGR
jgi:hypothetical protein